MLKSTPRHGRGPRSEPTGLNPGGEPMRGGTPRHGGQSGHVLMASRRTFLDMWRAKCSWIVVANSVSMCTRCNVFAYLKQLMSRPHVSNERFPKVLMTTWDKT